MPPFHIKTERQISQIARGDSVFRSSSNRSEQCQPFELCVLQEGSRRQRSSYASIDKTALVHFLGVVDVP
jgi:hypothetical protein